MRIPKTGILKHVDCNGNLIRYYSKIHYYHALKRRRLIKALFSRMVKCFNVDDLIIKLTFSERKINSFHRPFFNYDYDKPINAPIKHHKIILGLRGIDEDIKDGLIADYYNNRPLKINPHIIGNKKLCLRWVLLHELNHAIIQNKLGRRYHANMRLVDREKLADDFALAYCTIKF
jgi:hypothetical protein